MTAGIPTLYNRSLTTRCGFVYFSLFPRQNHRAISVRQYWHRRHTARTLIAQHLADSPAKVAVAVPPLPTWQTAVYTVVPTANASSTVSQATPTWRRRRQRGVDDRADPGRRNRDPLSDLSEERRTGRLPDRRGVPEPKVGVTAGLELERGRGAEPGLPDGDVSVAAVARGVRGLVPGPHELVGGFVKVVADCGGARAAAQKSANRRAGMDARREAFCKRMPPPPPPPDVI